MPVIATVGAAVIGGGLGLIGSTEAANAQSSAAAKAQAIAAQQAAAQQAQQNIANQFSLEQAQQQAANLSQYRAARQAVLGSFGINAPAGSISMPASSAGINSAPTTAAGITAQNPLLASLQKGQGLYNNPYVPAAALIGGTAALGLGAKFAFPNMGMHPVDQASQLAAAGASQPATAASAGPYAPGFTPAPPPNAYTGDLSGGNPFQVNVPQVTGIDPAVLAAYQGSVS